MPAARHRLRRRCLHDACVWLSSFKRIGAQSSSWLLHLCLILKPSWPDPLPGHATALPVQACPHLPGHNRGLQSPCSGRGGARLGPRRSKRHGRPSSAASACMHVHVRWMGSVSRGQLDFSAKHSYAQYGSQVMRAAPVCCTASVAVRLVPAQPLQSLASITRLLPLSHALSRTPLVGRLVSSKGQSPGCWRSDIDGGAGPPLRHPGIARPGQTPHALHEDPVQPRGAPRRGPDARVEQPGRRGQAQDRAALPAAPGRRCEGRGVDEQ